MIWIFLIGYFPELVLTCKIDWTQSLENNSLSPEISLEFIEVLTTFINPYSPNCSTSIDKCSLIKLIPYLQAVLKPDIITDGCICLFIII